MVMTFMATDRGNSRDIRRRPGTFQLELLVKESERDNIVWRDGRKVRLPSLPNVRRELRTEWCQQRLKMT